jgi:tetratricopeptide (TPR) repeat protein
MSYDKQVEKALETVRALSDEERFDEAIGVLEELASKVGEKSNCLVTKGRLILLSESDRYKAEDALQCFERALEVGNDSAEALLEIGWYFLTYENSAARAKPWFELAKSAAITPAECDEAEDGLAACLAED